MFLFLFGVICSYFTHFFAFHLSFCLWVIYNYCIIFVFWVIILYFYAIGLVGSYELDFDCFWCFLSNFYMVCFVMVFV